MGQNQKITAVSGFATEDIKKKSFLKANSMEAVFNWTNPFFSVKEN